jgi:ubiquinone/menaquinone biosynthesis C-methylase UbiE
MGQDIAYEHLASKAFTKQSGVFDQLYGKDGMIAYKRSRVRAVLQEYLPKRANLLELNSGTGEDAVWLASRGHSVHATDISEGMQEVMHKKITEAGLGKLITTENCSFNTLHHLQAKGPYDCIFSNFAGLNCTGDLAQVIRSFDNLLTPGGVAILVLLPRFCLWESLLLFRGMMKTATRRWFARSAVAAKVEGLSFPCWYYAPSFVRKAFGSGYSLLAHEGLCTIVPPSYIEGFDVRYPRAFSTMCKVEGRLKSRWPWRSIGDYYIVAYKKNG